MTEYVQVPRDLLEKIARDVGDIGMPKMEAALKRIIATPEAQVAPQGGGEVKSCTCVNVRQRELCMDKRECAQTFPLSTTQPAGTLSGGVEQVARDAFGDWFRGEQGKAYNGAWEIARAAWNAAIRTQAPIRLGRWMARWD